MNEPGLGGAKTGRRRGRRLYGGGGGLAAFGPSRAIALAGAAAIAIAAWWAFSSSLHGGWLWDDDEYVTTNPALRSAAGLGRIWAGRAGVNYFPLTDSVRWIQWRLWGMDPLGYRATNLVLHIASALLVWRLAAALSRGGGASGAGPGGGAGAWLAGLFFAVHPLAVETVAWVAELKNTLSLPLLLLALLAYLADRRGRALLCFVLALLSKSTVAMFPCVLLLHAWWRRGRLRPRDAWDSAPFFAVSLVLGIVTVWFEHTRAIGPSAAPLEGVGYRLVAAGLAAAFYLCKAVWPFHLIPIYPRWAVVPPSAAQLLPWPAFLGLGVWLATRRAAWARHALFALGSFFCSLLPVLGLIPMAFLRLAWASDHFAYVALVSIVLPAGLAADFGARRLARLGSVWRGVGVGAAAGLALFLACRSRAYARNYAGSEALWTRTLRLNPGAWTAHNDLGIIRFDQGRLKDALGEFKQAVRLNPRYPEAFNDLGVALAQSRQFGPAIAAYERALALRPAYAEAKCNLGNALLQTGRIPEAVAEYRQALALRDPFPEARYNLGLALRALGDEAGAEAQFRLAGGLR